VPWPGNPFGYYIDGSLAVPANFRHHYMVEKAAALMGGKGALAEIGGGWGDVGYFALRFCCWLPIGHLAPQRKLALPGEHEPRTVLANIEDYDAVLFPNFCMPLLPDNFADVFLNTHGSSEMRPETLNEYLEQISRTCRRYFPHENSDKPLHTLGHTEIPASSFRLPGFRLLSKAMSPWKAGGGRYREFLYQRSPRKVAA
jgi:hypothetical protein